MFISVQYLRAIAAFMVLLSHSIFKLKSNGSTLLDWYQIGGYGVDLFFIISGFIMCLTIEKKKESFFSFMKKRIVRIIPLYWVLTSVAFVIFLILPSAVNSSGGETSVIASYFLIPIGSKYLINNGWTLSYEFYFYFIFSLCFIFGFFQKQVTSLVLVFFVFMGVVFSFQSPLLTFLINPLLLEFILGIIAFKLIKNYRPSISLCALFIFFGVTGLILVNFFGGVATALGRSLNGGLPMFFIFIGLVFLERKVKMNKPLYELGMSSYSLYLFHPFSLALVTIIFKKLGLIDYSLIYLSVMLATSLFTGWLCYYYLEMKLDRWIRNRTQKI
ncbi:MAG: acyltransferase family protein [Pseudoalteromonas sp.]